MNMHVEHLRIFVAIAETRSFSAAAHRIGIAQSTASRAIQTLEDSVGRKLLARTTRRLHLTDAGLSLLPHAERLLRAHAAMLDDVSAHQGTLRGALCVSAVATLAHSIIAPRLAEIGTAHPHLRIELRSHHGRVGAVATLQDDVDVAVHVGLPPPSDLRTRRVGTSHHLSVAAPSLLRQAGLRAPISVDELGRLPAIGISSEGEHAPWILDDGAPREVRPRYRYLANDAESVRAMAVAGLGVTVLPDYVAASDLRSGALVRATRAVGMSLPIQAVWRSGTPPRKVEVLLAFLAEILGARA